MNSNNEEIFQAIEKKALNTKKQWSQNLQHACTDLAKADIAHTLHDIGVTLKTSSGNTNTVSTAVSKPPKGLTK